MIYTFTANPSLDYYLKLDNKLVSAQINRSVAEKYAAGGKGVNVSIVLNNLGIPSTILGFLGGFIRDYYLSFLQDYKLIQPLFTHISDKSRINIKIDDGLITSLNAKGPHISDTEFNKFNQLATRFYEDDCFVVGGNIPADLRHKMLDFLDSLSANNIKIFLDTDANFISNALKYKPYLVELDEYSLFSLTSEKDVFKALNKILKLGALKAIYKDKKYIYLANNKQIYYIANDEIYDAVGKDDAMMAGFLFALQRGGNDEDCFRYALTCAKLSYLLNSAVNEEEFSEILKGVNLKCL